MRRLLTLLPIAAVAAWAPAAHATEPSSGKVSSAPTTIDYTGADTSGGATSNAWETDSSAPCQSPSCDRLTLDVAAGTGDVRVSVELQVGGTGGNGNMSLRITKPDGTREVVTGESGPGVAFVHTIKNAAAGTYLIDHASSFLCCGESAFKGQIQTGPIPVEGAEGAPPAAAPVPAPAPAPTLKLLAPSKVKKGAKSLKVTLQSSGPLSGVNVLLTKGKKVVARGKLATLNGKKVLTLKIKKGLAKGTYGLAAGGKDSAGRNVTAGRKISVK